MHYCILMLSHIPRSILNNFLFVHYTYIYAHFCTLCVYLCTFLCTLYVYVFTHHIHRSGQLIYNEHSDDGP